LAFTEGSAVSMAAFLLASFCRETVDNKTVI
jgi:hypothetical protein